MCRNSLIALTILSLVPLTATLAEDDQKPKTTTQSSRQSDPHAAGEMDSDFAVCLTIDNQAEVALAEMAQKKSKNEKVKEFASKMVEDHTQFIQKLSQFNKAVSERALRIDAGTSERRESREASEGKDKNPDTKKGTEKDEITDKKAADRPAERNPATARKEGSAGDKHLELKRELAQECLNDTAKELSGKSDKEFDQCYMTQQAMAHHKMISELKVLSRHASSSLKPVLEDGLQTAQMHLKHAKELVKSLENDSQTARSDTKTKAE